MAFKPARDYEATLQFCENIGAEIAVATTDSVYALMYDVSTDVCPSKPFYLGYTDRRTEGTFLDSVSGAPLTLKNWREGEPNNWGGGEDCLATHPRATRQAGLLSLVENCRGFALIGWILLIALLCHKAPAQGGLNAPFTPSSRSNQS